jgi:hypothetical protein
MRSPMLTQGYRVLTPLNISDGENIKPVVPFCSPDLRSATVRPLVIRPLARPEGDRYAARRA